MKILIDTNNLKDLDFELFDSYASDEYYVGIKNYNIGVPMNKEDAEKIKDFLNENFSSIFKIITEN